MKITRHEHSYPPGNPFLNVNKSIVHCFRVEIRFSTGVTETLDSSTLWNLHPFRSYVGPESSSRDEVKKETTGRTRCTFPQKGHYRWTMVTND